MSRFWKYFSYAALLSSVLWNITSYYDRFIGEDPFRSMLFGMLWLIVYLIIRFSTHWEDTP